jgi:hypothetical protein|uniref:Uncharacterized protein n=1 Tax=Eutreptiella gymnastica TaxID=73025 RepID=A0A7S4GG90_9EUGL|mmetsp:Transcript_30190/g.51047  ORF Transcript_30190/g.51047 Transcript_30190/m.51047 type:complete len:102 (+) Transcript_30190:257-562(+)
MRIQGLYGHGCQQDEGALPNRTSLKSQHHFLGTLETGGAQIDQKTRDTSWDNEGHQNVTQTFLIAPKFGPVLQAIKRGKGSKVCSQKARKDYPHSPKSLTE